MFNLRQLAEPERSQSEMQTLSILSAPLYMSYTDVMGNIGESLDYCQEERYVSGQEGSIKALGSAVNNTLIYATNSTV